MQSLRPLLTLSLCVRVRVFLLPPSLSFSRLLLRGFPASGSPSPTSAKLGEQRAARSAQRGKKLRAEPPSRRALAGAIWVSDASSPTPKARSPITRRSTRLDYATAPWRVWARLTPAASAFLRVLARRLEVSAPRCRWRLPEGDLLLCAFGEGDSLRFVTGRGFLTWLKELRSKAVARYSHGMAAERPKESKESKEQEEPKEEPKELKESDEGLSGGPRSLGASGSGATSANARSRSLRRRPCSGESLPHGPMRSGSCGFEDLQGAGEKRG